MDSMTRFRIVPLEERILLDAAAAVQVVAAVENAQAQAETAAADSQQHSSQSGQEQTHQKFIR